MKIIHILAAGAAVLGVAAPAAAQVGYGQPYPPQPYPQYQQPYQQPYGQPYQQANPVQQIINQLLGNRYNNNDRNLVQRCATAALTHASQQYRPQGNAYGYQGQGYGYGQQQYGYGQPVVIPAGMRVTNITQVERVRNGVRVRGLISSGMMNGAYGNPYGQQNPYAPQGYVDPRYPQPVMADLQFRCNVDARGAITNLRVTRNRG
jgi:hypothetical protein